MRPTIDDKKMSITISLDREIFNILKVKNKSKLINWLLQEYLNSLGYEIKNKF